MLSRNFSVLSAARASFFVSKQLRVSLNPCLRWQRSDQPRESLRTFNYNLLIRARSESRKEFFFLPTSNEFFGVSLRHSGKHPQTRRAIPGIKTMLETKIDRAPWNEVGGCPNATSDVMKARWNKIQLNGREYFIRSCRDGCFGNAVYGDTDITHTPRAVLCEKRRKPQTKSVLAQRAAKVQLGNVQKKFLFAKKSKPIRFRVTGYSSPGGVDEKSAPSEILLRLYFPSEWTWTLTSRAPAWAHDFVPLHSTSVFTKA